MCSTGPQGDLTSVGHRMVDDSYGRPGTPVCGCSTNGLWFRRDVSGERVPVAQQCSACAQR